jgi:hypothetical protein
VVKIVNFKIKILITLNPNPIRPFQKAVEDDDDDDEFPN